MKEWSFDTRGLFKIVLVNALLYYFGLPWYFYVLMNGCFIGFTWNRKTE